MIATAKKTNKNKVVAFIKITSEVEKIILINLLLNFYPVVYKLPSFTQRYASQCLIDIFTSYNLIFCLSYS